jgi:hypothetical protein
MSCWNCGHSNDKSGRTIPGLSTEVIVVLQVMFRFIAFREECLLLAFIRAEFCWASRLRVTLTF